MKKHVLLSMLAAALITGCASTPKSALIPDGSNRTEVNSDAKIQDYTAKTAESESNTRERSALERKVDDLSRQVAELKAYIVKLDEASMPKKTKVVAKKAKAKTIAHRAVKKQDAPAKPDSKTPVQPASKAQAAAPQSQPFVASKP